jgi:FMN-dependent NADH-azoreductase
VASLLHLDSSAHRSSESITRRLTARFAATWRAEHGPAGYRHRDLAADPVPPLGSAYCALGRRAEQHGQVPLAAVETLAASPAERREWAQTRPLITELLAASSLLIGAPMYNYSVPAALKAWIDRVSFPGAFTDPGTGERLLGGLRVVVVVARGGTYGPGSPREGCDFELPYLRAYFGRQGVPEANISFVSADLTLTSLAPHLVRFRPQAARSLAAAWAEVGTLAGVRP